MVSEKLSCRPLTTTVMKSPLTWHQYRFKLEQRIVFTNLRFFFRKKSSFEPTFLLPKSNDPQRLLSKEGLLKVYGIFINYKCQTKLDLDFSNESKSKLNEGLSNEHKSYEKRLLCAPDMTNCCSIKWYGLNFSSNSRRDAKPTMHIWKCHLK